MATILSQCVNTMAADDQAPYSAKSPNFHVHVFSNAVFFIWN